MIATTPHPLNLARQQAGFLLVLLSLCEFPLDYVFATWEERASGPGDLASEDLEKWYGSLDGGIYIPKPAHRIKEKRYPMPIYADLHACKHAKVSATHRSF